MAIPAQSGRFWVIPIPDGALGRLAPLDPFHGLADLHADLELRIVLVPDQGRQVIPFGCHLLPHLLELAVARGLG